MPSSVICTKIYIYIYIYIYIFIYILTQIDIFEEDIYIYIYIYIYKRAHQYSSDQMKMKILKDQSVQTTANVESVAHIYNKYNYILIYIQTALYKYIYTRNVYETS